MSGWLNTWLPFAIDGLRQSAQHCRHAATSPAALAAIPLRQGIPPSARATTTHNKVHDVGPADGRRGRHAPAARGRGAALRRAAHGAADGLRHLDPRAVLARVPPDRRAPLGALRHPAHRRQGRARPGLQRARLPVHLFVVHGARRGPRRVRRARASSSSCRCSGGTRCSAGAPRTSSRSTSRSRSACSGRTSCASTSGPSCPCAGRRAFGKTPK